MTCDQYRESASARLDGEEPGLPDAALDAHLAGCRACAAWCAAAQRVTRLARIAALAVAVGWTAVRPRHAAGLLPLLAAFGAVLTVTSVADLRGGQVDLQRVSTHVLVWCAVALLAALIWVRRAPWPSLGGRGGGVRPGEQPVAGGPAQLAEPADPPGRAFPRPAAGR